MGECQRWPMCSSQLGTGWIDTGTMCLARSSSPTLMGLNSTYSPSLALARGFMFIVFEQLPNVGAGKIIRKVAVVPRDFSLAPQNPLGSLSPAEHVLNMNPSQSPFLSASNRPIGAASITGEALLLNTTKIIEAGGQIFSVDEVVRDLEGFVAKNPAARAQVDKLIATIKNIEGEVLVKGSVPPGAAKPVSPVHQAFIRSAEDLWQQFRSGALSRPELERELALLEKSYERIKVVGKVGRVITVVGLVLTAVDLTRAANQSVKTQSFKPITAEVVRQAGGWGMALAGAKIGAVGGAAVGVETGPGLFITGAIGALVFGALGFFGSDLIADQISPN
ncbi:hypothetical protein BurJ1DRAFT_4062 [Burkholderiales bacterium JOSHI_001]|nr:hypothetical protein BurJ1DRAFT_4062 [Burkholderiales bacterium JOSHI_001]